MPRCHVPVSYTHLEYTLENGRVVMDGQSRAQLQKLLSDEEAVANVLLSNEQVQACLLYTSRCV